MSLTTEQVKDRLDYVPDTGELVWKKARSLFIGMVAGTRIKRGYLRVAIDKKSYLAHRLIWLWHGNKLSDELDHIDGNTSNNRIENLRIATHAQNTQNASIRGDNKVGIKGVTWHKASRKWMVSIQTNKKRLHLGVYEDLEFAELLAIEARIKFHGNYARLQ